MSLINGGISTRRAMPIGCGVFAFISCLMQLANWWFLQISDAFAGGLGPESLTRSDVRVRAYAADVRQASWLAVSSAVLFGTGGTVVLLAVLQPRHRIARLGVSASPPAP